MKRQFKFTVLLFKEEKPYMEYTFNTVKPMFFSQAYKLLFNKIRHDFPVCLGYEFTIISVSSKPYIDSDL
nr:MAG TPA: hypothetical protein [Microviridae sp.]